MDCPQCGVRNEPAKAVCSKCGAALQTAEGAASVPETAEGAAAAPAVFRDPKRLTWWLQSLLVGIVVLGVAPVVFQLAGLRADLLRPILGTCLLALYIATVVMFCAWTYRVNANLHALGASNLRFTPGWAVGWYFVPLANLWKPYQVMSEIWRASKSPGGWQYEASSSIVGWWWFLWVVSNVRISFESSSQPEAADPSVTPISFTLWALDLIAVVFAFLVVRRVGAFQAKAGDRSLSAIFA